MTTAPPPYPRSNCSESRQIVLAYHLAHRLLPAVEHIMALHQEEVGCSNACLVCKLCLMPTCGVMDQFELRWQLGVW